MSWIFFRAYCSELSINSSWTKSPVAPLLDDLLNGYRLARVFSDCGRYCALQLWALQIKSGKSTENRVVYGRLLPYIHANAAWSASNNSDFESVGNIKA